MTHSDAPPLFAREQRREERMSEDFDVIVVGAGLSGVSAGYHLQRDCPTRSYAILEARDAMGGTWDLFRYPGIRSDSDMHTLGFSFRPWRGEKAIADWFVDPALCGGYRARIWHRPAYPLRPPRAQRELDG
ncbi:hypothetical protein GCM10011329_27820 [Stakelama pacifica]|nr:hypothetical protein GCM10011329_27820 [Stakelama pacifica]